MQIWRSGFGASTKTGQKVVFNKKIENLVEKVSGSKTCLVIPLDILLNNKSNVL